MLPVELKVGFRYTIGVGEVVAIIGASQPMCTGTILSPPTNRSIDRNLSDVNALRHKFSC